VNVAIVTGGTSGLGAEIADLLSDRGYEVVRVSRRSTGDASKRETARAATEEAQRRGTLNLLVNCAGVGIYKPAGSYTSEDIEQMMNANLLGTITFCEAVIPLFVRNGGTIVNVLSSAAQAGKPNETIYCAAKWGARGYSEALREEMKGKPVRVMSVFPGGMDTPFWPERREHFMPPREVAAAIVDALFAKVFVSELAITRT
jgi:short-subunit dehydrogenase